MGRLWQRDLREHDERWCVMRDARAPWDTESKIDYDYEAGKIYTPDELAVFAGRSQPAARFQLIRRMVNLILGIEAQTRSDGLALPRTPQAAAGAEAMTKLLKFESSRSKLPRNVSRVMRDVVIGGVGYIDQGYQSDPSKPKIYQRWTSPDMVYEDPASVEPDWEDALDVIRAGYYRPYELITRFTKHKKLIASLVNPSVGNDYKRLSHSSDYSNAHNGEPPMYGNSYPGMYNHGQQYYGNSNSVDRTRGLILACERQYRDYDVKLITALVDGRTFEVTDENYEGIAGLILRGDATMPEEKAICEIRVACFIPGIVLLSDELSPYDHGEFSLTKFQAYVDENKRPCGVVRAARDPQKEYSVRKASALKRLLGTKWMAEKGATLSLEKLRRQLNSNESLVELEVGGIEKLKKIESESISAELEFAADAQRMVYDSAGVTQELIGVAGAAKSGTAIESLKNQGQTALFTIFDQRNASLETVYRKGGSLIADTYSEEMAVRVNKTGRGVEFITVNQQGDKNGQIENDITSQAFDYELVNDMFHSTNQLAQLDAINGFLANATPELKLMFAPEVAQLMSLPDSQKTVERIEKLVGAMLGSLLAPQGVPAGADPNTAPMGATNSAAGPVSPAQNPGSVPVSPAA